MDVDLHGYFWVPEDADRRIRGRLTWSASAGGELTLEGILSPGGHFAATAATLCGRTLGGIPMVLRDTFVRRAQIAAEVTQRWRVNYAYLGTSEAEPRTAVLAVELDGLGAFTRPSALSITGNLGPRDPVHITWTPADPLLSVATPDDGKLDVVDERRLLLEQEEFAVRHVDYLRVTVPQAQAWHVAAQRLGLLAGLLELLADRPMTVRRQWRPAQHDDEDIDHFFQPIIGKPPDDPDGVWLKLEHVRSRLENAVGQWIRLFETRPELVTLVIEEVRFRRSTNAVDRILRLTRILELLHREQHPSATPDDDAEIDKVNAVMEAASEELRGWLCDRLGLTLIRLRQRIRETVADLPGIEALLGDVDDFARAATKTRNWHTHYGDPRGVVKGEYAAYLAIRLWLLVRGALLLALGWDAPEAVTLVERDHQASWVAGRPTRPDT